MAVGFAAGYLVLSTKYWVPSTAGDMDESGGVLVASDNAAELSPVQSPASEHDSDSRLLKLRTIIGLVMSPVMFAVVLLFPVPSIKPAAHRSEERRGGKG